MWKTKKTKKKQAIEEQRIPWDTCVRGKYHKLKFEFFISIRENQFIVTEFPSQQVGH